MMMPGISRIATSAGRKPSGFKPERWAASLATRKVTAETEPKWAATAAALMRSSRPQVCISQKAINGVAMPSPSVTNPGTTTRAKPASATAAPPFMPIANSR